MYRAVVSITGAPAARSVNVIVSKLLPATFSWINHCGVIGNLTRIVATSLRYHGAQLAWFCHGTTLCAMMTDENVYGRGTASDTRNSDPYFIKYAISPTTGSFAVLRLLPLTLRCSQHCHDFCKLRNGSADVVLSAATRFQ